MKIIFSRKGIDSSFGNCASPIMPDESLCWFPIPENNRNKPGLPTYDDIAFHDTNLGTIISDLSSGKISGDRTVHLDPDLYYFHKKRLNGWKPIFGQTGAAESHLRNHSIGIGDIFLFFGWFRKIAQTNDKYHFDGKAPNLHVAYGWMQVGNIVKIRDMSTVEPWMKDHPHLLGEKYGESDTLYIASNKLIVNNTETPYSGAGYFPRLFSDIILTAQGQTRSVWELPLWFYPSKGKPALSYNENIDKWAIQENSVHLRIASRGQEFIFDADFYPEAVSWLMNIIKQSQTHLSGTCDEQRNG